MTIAPSLAVGRLPGCHVAGWIAGSLISLIWRIYCWHWRRSAVAELSALDDRMLDDIGLHRSTIPAAVHEACSRGGWHHVGC